MNHMTNNKTVVAPKSAPLAAPSIETGSAKVPHVHSTWEKGDSCHQGDLILVCVGSLPKSAKKRENRQLAEGDTRGSKHHLIGGTVYAAAAAECASLVKAATGAAVEPMYTGLCFAGKSELLHPEHQHQHFPDHACTIVVHQRNLDSEERAVRAMD